MQLSRNNRAQKNAQLTFSNLLAPLVRVIAKKRYWLIRCVYEKNTNIDIFRVLTNY